MDTGYTNFNARAYLKERCPGNEFALKADSCFNTQWRLRCLHDFYQEFHKEWDNSKASLLEFGAGPNVHTLISAAPYVGQIYHSDYVEGCRKEVLLWKNKDPDAYDWSPYFQFVVNTLEGQGGNDVAAERQELLRSKLKESLFLDIKSDNPLPANPGLFDIIYTGFCIESVALSSEEFKLFMKRVFDLLKPNGYLMMLASQECTWYTVNGIKYQSYPITVEEVLTTLRELGFTLHYVESVKKKYENGVTYYSDKKANSCYIAQKNV